MRNRVATINNAYLHAKHNAKAMARPKEEKSEARWRDYAADNYYHYYYRYGEDEKGAPLADDHRKDDLLELACQAVKDLTSYKHYEGGVTAKGVGNEMGFAFTRRRLGCYCVPAEGASCSHAGWTGEVDRGVCVPVNPTRSGAARDAADGEAERPLDGFPPGHRRELAALHARRRGGRDGGRREHLVRQRARAAGAISPPLVTHSLLISLVIPVMHACHHPSASSHRFHHIHQEKNTKTFQCGPCKLIMNHYSVPVQWLNLVELTDEHAIFEVWPTEQDRIAVKHLMDMPDLKWDKVEGDRFYMSRAQYDAGNDQL